MNITSIIAIYFLFFCFSAFLLLPFGIKTTEELGEECVPGQAESAPHRFDLRRHLARSAVVAAIFCGLYVLNYLYGWITPDDLDFYH